MNTMSKTIVFFGNERLATGVTTDTPVVKQLLADGYNIAAIVANQHESGGRSFRQLEIANFASEHKIPLLFPKILSEISSQLSKLGAEAGVLAAYGKIVPSSVINLFPKGIVNMHPSLLPKHRGPIPLESVILDGSQLTGVSIMQLASQMDAGPIYAQSEVELSGQESKQDLADKLLDVGSAMLSEVLPGILNGSVVALPQDNSAATYDSLINKSDGQLDFTKPALRLAREVRAYAGWPGSRTSLAGVDVTVTAAHAVPTRVPNRPGHVEIIKDEGNLMVNTEDGYLCIDRLRPAGKNEMTAAEFLRGYGDRV